MMVVLKIPIVYLGLVVCWAVKAEPEPPEPRAARCGARARAAAALAAARRGRPRPGPHGSPDAGCAAARAVVARVSAHPARSDRGLPRRSPACSPRSRSSSSLIGVAYRPVRLIPFAIAARADRDGDGRPALAPGGCARWSSAGVCFVVGMARRGGYGQSDFLSQRRFASRGNRAGTTKTVSMHDVDGLNAGYAQRAARAVPREPRGGPGRVARAVRERRRASSSRRIPGLARLLELLREDGNGARRRAAEPRRAAAAAGADARAAGRRRARRRAARRRRRGDGARQGATACTATSPRGSTRSARSRSATRRSSPSGSSRR